MNEKFNQIFEEIKKESLTQSERASMRNNVQLYMSEHTPRAPFHIRAADSLTQLLGAFDTGAQKRLVPAVLSLVLLVGAGTSYAAEHALPGDLLYPIKIHVNENVQGSLAVSESSQAEWNTELMTRRLQEAEALTSQDRLTPVARADIQNQLLSTAKRFDDNVAAIARTENSAPEVAAAQSNLKVSLEGHAKALAALTADVSDVQSGAESSSTRTAVAATAPTPAHITAKTVVVMPPVPKAAALAPQNDSEIRAVATMSAEIAPEEIIASTTSASEDAKPEAPVSTEVISKAGTDLGRGEHIKAFGIFREVIQAAHSSDNENPRPTDRSYND